MVCYNFVLSLDQKLQVRLLPQESDTHKIGQINGGRMITENLDSGLNAKKNGSRGKRKKLPDAIEETRKKRTSRPYPSSSFEDALYLANQIQKFAAGEKVRRLTLCQKMEKSPTSSAVQMLITNSGKYGITIGSYAAEWLELTADGKLASAVDGSLRERLRARFRLAIEGIAPFKVLHDEYKGKRLPSHEVIGDFLQSKINNVSDVTECIDTFIVNAKFLGLLQTIAGSEMLLPIDQVVDEINEGAADNSFALPVIVNGSTVSSRNSTERTDWSKVCFYIAPIGATGSEARKHSDLFLNSIVEPALKDFGLSVVRADKIGESGMITSQILEHILKSKLAIVDLSLHNPNAFYELAIRHATRLPIVQIIRKNDRIPFDVDQIRTIEIDTTDIYSLVPQIETYRSEIANHVRHILSNQDNVTNPLTVFCPGFHVSLPSGF